LIILAERKKLKFTFTPGNAVFRKGKSVELTKKDMYNSFSSLDEILNSKLDLFLNNPHILLSIENFGNLTIIEDYLLNKFDSKVNKSK